MFFRLSCQGYFGYLADAGTSEDHARCINSWEIHRPSTNLGC